MEPTSPTLMLRLKADGPAREIAWAEFRSRYAPVIGGFARNLGVRPGEVEDVVQDVLLGFFAVQPRFVYDPKAGRLRGYLKTCVAHQLSRQSRRRLKVDGRPVEELDPADAAVEQAWADSWEREQLNRAIEQVRAQMEDGATFQAFHRVAVGREDPAAVAASLSMTLAAVYKAKSRCVARLRAALQQIEEEEG